MAIKYIITKNSNELKTLIADTISYAKTMQEKVQICAVAILAHAEKHGDWTKANDLVLGLPDGVKKDALVEYFVKCGGLVVGEEGFASWSGADFIRKNFDNAKKKMWWTYKKQNPFAGYNLDAEIDKLIKRAQDQINQRTKWLEGDSESNKEKAAKIDVDAAKLKALVDIMTGTKADANAQLNSGAPEQKREKVQHVPTKKVEKVATPVFRHVATPYAPIIPHTWDETRLAEIDGKLVDSLAPKTA